MIKHHPSPKDGRVCSVDLEIYDLQTQTLKVWESQSVANIAILEADGLDQPQWLTKGRDNYQ